MVQYYSMSHKFHSISNYDDIFMCSLVCLYYIRTGKRGFRLLVGSQFEIQFSMQSSQRSKARFNGSTLDSWHQPSPFIWGQKSNFHVGEVVIRNSSKFNLEGSGRRTWPLTWWVGVSLLGGAADIRHREHADYATRSIFTAQGHRFLLEIQIGPLSFNFSYPLVKP